MSKILKVISNEEIEIIEYKNPRVAFNDTNYTDGDLLYVLRKRINPFTLYYETQKLQYQLEQKEAIIKEAREFIEWHYRDNKEFYKNKGIGLNYPECDYLLQILSRGDKDE